MGIGFNHFGAMSTTGYAYAHFYNIHPTTSAIALLNTKTSDCVNHADIGFCALTQPTGERSHCNRYKSERLDIIDPVTEERVPLFHPQLQVWKEHFTWNEDASEIIGLTDIGRATIAALKMNRLPLVRVRKMWIKLGEHPPKLELLGKAITVPPNLPKSD